MKTGTRLLFTGLGMGLGYLIGGSIGQTEEEKRKNSMRGLLIGGGTSFALTFAFGENEDTKNYALENRGRRVYDGIAKESRVESRIDEHRRDGKVFDAFIIDSGTKTKENALRLEKYRIRRNKGKYNIHHNIWQG